MQETPTISSDAASAGTADRRLLIDGRLLDTERMFPSINPATGEVLGYAPDATVADAEAAVAAMRYPPRGVRGISTLTRATGFGRTPDYLARAEQELCLIVQIETRAGLDAIEAIAAVDGVDGLFIGPSDLSASLGHLGDPGHPDMVATIEDAIARIRAAGKPAGVLTLDPTTTRRAIALGTDFIAIGTDLGLLARGADALRAEYRS